MANRTHLRLCIAKKNGVSTSGEVYYDAHAIVVRINGEPVAHIKKEDNVSLRQQLDALGFSDDVQCRAEIEGGWDHGGSDIGKYSVKLDITFPLDVRPAPKPPASREKH